MCLALWSNNLRDPGAAPAEEIFSGGQQFHLDASRQRQPKCPVEAEPLEVPMQASAPPNLTSECSIKFPEAIEKTLAMQVTGAPLRISNNRFQNCALVGSGANLLGKKMGARIDSHCPVIRINRMPTEQFLEDVGIKTHIFYANRWELLHNISLMGAARPGCKDFSEPSCYDSVDCTEGGPRCPSSGIFFKPCKECKSIVAKRWRRSPVPIGCSSKPLVEFVSNRRLNSYFRGKSMSTGMMAFMSFAPHCANITLYGFAGSGTLDGHQESDQHIFSREHCFYRLAAGRRINLGILADGPERDFQLLQWMTWVVQALNSANIRIVDR